MMTKLRTGALALTLMGAVGFAFWQHQQIKRLIDERAALHNQAGQAAWQHDEIQRLATQVKESVEGSKADRDELIRLRAQSSRLRQVEEENARLRIERQRLASQVSQANQAAILSGQQQDKQPGFDMNIPFLPAGVTDLGVVDLSNPTPMRLDLGEGKECMVTTTVLNDGQVEMVFKTESKTSEGLTIQKEQRMTVLPNRQMISVIDGVEVALTPTLKTNENR